MSTYSITAKRRIDVTAMRSAFGSTNRGGTERTVSAFLSEEAFTLSPGEQRGGFTSIDTVRRLEEPDSRKRDWIRQEESPENQEWDEEWFLIRKESRDAPET